MIGNEDYSSSKTNGFNLPNIDDATPDVDRVREFYLNSYIQFDKIFELKDATKEEV